MARRNQNQQNQADGGDQPGAAGEVPTGGEQAASLPSAPAADDVAQLGDEPLAVPTTEGPIDAGGGGEAENVRTAPVQDAETRSSRAFFGRSGHLAVMSEFLYRRINVAIPEVDVGDDVFVVKGSDDTVTRVQVKAATAKAQAGGSYFALFNVPFAQLAVPRDTPALVYVFAVRFQNRWSRFLVIRRSTLFARFNEGAGRRIIPPTGKEYVQFRITFTEAAAQCGPVDFHRYCNVWEPWPPLQLEEEDGPIQAQVNAIDAGEPGDASPSVNLGEPQPPDGPAATIP
jgi:hypothetical protein